MLVLAEADRNKENKDTKVSTWRFCSSEVTSPWRWKQQGPPKCLYPMATLQGIKTQKTSAWSSMVSLFSSFLSSLLFSYLITWIQELSTAVGMPRGMGWHSAGNLTAMTWKDKQDKHILMNNMHRLTTNIRQLLWQIGDRSKTSNCYRL
jgi:hypothetical protein